MDFISCNGSEWRLWDDCTHFTHYYGCSHEDDVGVQCRPGRVIAPCPLCDYCIDTIQQAS